jgi:membrane associated rhomboid family serine protease
MSDGNSNGTGAASAAQVIASALVALGFLALVGIIFWRATELTQNFDKIWAATGAIVGVVIGAIPSFFFQRQVRAERTRSSVLADRATALAATSSADQVKEAIQMVPHAF